MGSDSPPADGQVDVCGGVARLPQSSSNLPVLLTVEIEIDTTTQSVRAVHVNPDLGGLKRIIEGALVGQPASAMGTAGVAAIMEHYHSPFRNAARAALLHAWEAYTHTDRQSPVANGEAPARLRARFLD